MLGPHATKADIVVAIVGIVAVAVIRAQVARIVVVPRATADGPFCDRLPFLPSKNDLLQNPVS